MNGARPLRVVISGCSGGGKSTLLEELSRRGFSTVPEPGRRIVEEELRGDGGALPWVSPAAFARRAIDLARRDRQGVAASTGWVFFDRGLVDAAAALQFATKEPALSALGSDERYHDQVFLAPPWPEIYVCDRERRHGFDEAVAEYDHLVQAYANLGYETLILPKATVVERVDFILRRLGCSIMRAPGQDLQAE